MKHCFHSFFHWLQCQWVGTWQQHAPYQLHDMNFAHGTSSGSTGDCLVFESLQISSIIGNSLKYLTPFHLLGRTTSSSLRERLSLTLDRSHPQGLRLSVLFAMPLSMPTSWNRDHSCLALLPSSFVPWDMISQQQSRQVNTASSPDPQLKSRYDY